MRRFLLFCAFPDAMLAWGQVGHWVEKGQKETLPYGTQEELNRTHRRV